MLWKFSLIILLLLSLTSCNFSEKKEERIITPEKNPAEEIKDSSNADQEAKGLEIFSPAEGDIVSSPLELKGKAKGTWYFEANFGVKLLDQDYNVLEESYVIATEDWMTEDWVPFEGTLKFNESISATGFLVFEKANPSGLEEHALSDTLQIRFRK